MTEWLDEPDKDEFEHDGLKGLILRNSELGHLCGYVAVPKVVKTTTIFLTMTFSRLKFMAG